MFEFVGLYYLVVAIAVGLAAGARGRSEIGWIIAAVIVTPPMAALLLIACPERKQERLSFWQSGPFAAAPPPKPKQDPRWAALHSTPSEPRQSLSPEAAAKSERRLNIAFIVVAVVVVTAIILGFALEQSIR